MHAFGIFEKNDVIILPEVVCGYISSTIKIKGNIFEKNSSIIFPNHFQLVVSLIEGPRQNGVMALQQR